MSKALLQLTLLAYNTRFVASQISKLGIKDAIKKYGPKLVKKGQEFLKKKNTNKVNPAKEKIDKGVKSVKDKKITNKDFKDTKLGSSVKDSNFDTLIKKTNKLKKDRTEVVGKTKLNKKGSDIYKGMFKKP
tara:strand:+ start:2731 stop:3123 length:393 start_codon:yes stop_codon:yes gene_type:complete